MTTFNFDTDEKRAMTTAYQSLGDLYRSCGPIAGKHGLVLQFRKDNDKFLPVAVASNSRAKK